MFKGFKEFILRGNVIDLAVAVVIGAAFTAVVNSIVSSIINPLIEIFWKPAEDGTVGIPVQGFYGEVVFPVGDLLNAVIAFFAVALVGFAVGAAGLMLSPISYPIFWVGIGVILLGGVVFVVMAKMGMHESGH